MSETATENTATPSAEELQKMWDALPDQVRDAVSKVNTLIDAHNRNIALIKASQGDESKKLLFELRDQNPNEDAEISKYNSEIEKVQARYEDLIAKANKRAEVVYADQLKMPSETEVAKARESVSKSGSELRAAVKGFASFEDFLGVSLSAHIKDIGSLKGTGAKASSGGGDIWRPRTEAIYVNGELIQAEVQNSKGVKELKSTFNVVASHLNKLTNGKNFTTVDLQQAYLKAAGGDKDKIAEEVEFTLPFTTGDTTVNFAIKVKK